jgi:NitT/TauT family transport system permease protein
VSQASAATETARPRSNGRARIELIVWGGRIALLASFIGLWEASVRFGWMDPFFIGRPAEIGKYLVEGLESGLIWLHARVTLAEALAGLFFGSAGGILTGFLLARFPLAERVLDPFLLALNALPRIALAPIFILWLGLGPASKIAVSISLVYFILVINTRAGVRSVDSDLLIASRLLGATPRQQFIKVILPSCVPPIFAGLRLGIQYSLLGAVGAELIGAERGMGQQIAYFAGTFQVSGVFAMLIVLAVISMTLALSASALERRLLRWQEP